MKVFVTGVNGQLGHDVMNELAKRGHEGIGSGSAPEYSGLHDGTAVSTMPYVQLNITDGDAVDRAVCRIAPEAVIHCAAWTAVDLAEDEDKRAAVREVNVQGTENIAKACCKTDSKLLYLSTDYVFDGKGSGALELPGAKYEFRYKIRENTVSLDFSDDKVRDISYEFTVDADKLTIERKEKNDTVIHELKKQPDVV